MARFNALLLAAVIGACIGSALRPSPIEVIAVALLVGIVWPKLILGARRRRQNSVKPAVV